MEINWTTIITAAVAAGFTLAASVVTQILNSWLRRREAHSIGMQEKQAEVISELYALLSDARVAAIPILDPRPMRHPKHEEMSKGFEVALLAWTTYFRRKAIYFDQQTCNNLNQLVEQSYVAFQNADAYHSERGADVPSKLKAVEANSGPVRERMDTILAQLADRFRKLGGVSTS